MAWINQRTKKLIDELLVWTSHEDGGLHEVMVLCGIANEGLLHVKDCSCDSICNLSLLFLEILFPQSCPED